MPPDDAHGRIGRALTRSDPVDALHRDDCAALPIAFESPNRTGSSGFRGL